MRLNGARLFQRVFKRGVRTRSPAFTVLARRNDVGYGRLGLAIARKHLRKAVDRNRVKRHARESFRKRQLELRGIDIVVTGRTDLARLTTKDIDAMLETHWTEILRRVAPAAPLPAGTGSGESAGEPSDEPSDEPSEHGRCP